MMFHNRKTIASQPNASEINCLQVSEYIDYMFGPIESKNRSIENPEKMKVRDGWLLFLGTAYKKIFNPAIPGYSGLI